VHTSGVTTRLAALRLYHCRRNVRDRDYECDSGIRASDDSVPCYHYCIVLAFFKVV